ncbi:hypothetical protein CCO03_11695 [Comamonas serinivorans]|uniref:Tetrapyrrole biosynthesis uroporphyrinogen III synthase domain-containing protein n=1 Tax=Comamonas serinivorans TaxID=1082851 RepID=A0A1Y0ENN9_9BURK|nr:uroporphyrinogen-III synthase [Comamonas serinivorans]ARU05253.1 hypothetical protein CCO03_11695 [Comamonas serinivorans]
MGGTPADAVRLAARQNSPAPAAGQAGARTWWVTRPQPEADDWVARLQAQGIAARALPLLSIAAAPDPQALRARADELRAGQWQAVMFVSANAVRGLLAAAPDLARAFGTTARAWAPGPGTAQALLDAGLAPEAVDRPAAHARQFESESLWAQVAGQVVPSRAGQPFRLLLIRGADEGGQIVGRNWLLQQVHNLGGVVGDVAAYQRGRPGDLPARLRALPPGRQGWLFSSSHAVANLLAEVFKQSAGAEQAWRHDWSCDQALCTHARVAQAAQALGFASVHVCRPVLAEVVASIESLA